MKIIRTRVKIGNHKKKQSLPKIIRTRVIAEESERRLLIYDVSNLAHRALHACDPYRDQDQLSRKVLYGLLIQLIPPARIFKPTSVIFAFDTFINKRKQIFADYKANRESKLFPEIDEFYVFLKESNLGFPTRHSGFEADDIIAYLAKKYDGTFTKIRIVSSDKDLYQCLTKNVSIYQPAQKQLVTDKTFMKEYGIKPKKWLLVKALMGDISDNVPGVPGVGEKSAIRYVKNELKKTSRQFNSIEKTGFIIDRNLKLMKIPLEGMLPITITNWDIFPSLTKFEEFCKYHKFLDLLSRSYEWKKHFNMR